jgi:hypothetical protein
LSAYACHTVGRRSTYTASAEFPEWTLGGDPCSGWRRTHHYWIDAEETMRRWMMVVVDRPWLLGLLLTIVAAACNDGGGSSGRSGY